MRILFIHQNFPSQFRNLAPSLVRAGHEIVAMTMRDDMNSNENGVRIIPYSLSRGNTPGIHPWLKDMESKVTRGQYCADAALKLKDEGFSPSIIIAHHGWGESLFLKEVWPDAKLGIYCEFYYHAIGMDVGFDPEFPSNNQFEEACKIKLRNINNLLHFQTADAGIAPTHWQANTFPEPFRSKIEVVHDGINTDVLAPNPSASLTLNNRLTLTREDEIVTFVSRTLEPYRGYHVFMRALPKLLKVRPNARILIVGGDGGGYGMEPTEGTTWREMFLKEIEDRMSETERQRIHFLGHVSYNHFVTILQLSSIHVYLTYPFVLSWSLIEAMSIGCTIVASDTAPVKEVIQDNENGKLVNFFDPVTLADEIVELLENPSERLRLSSAARNHVKEHYDLNNNCLPKQIAWVESLFDNKQRTI